MAFHLLRGLSEFPGLDLSVIILNRGRLVKELEVLGIPFQLIDEAEQSFPKIVWAAAKFLGKQSPHVLHSHRYKENILASLISTTWRERGVLISTQHGMPEFYNGSPSLLHNLKSRLNHALMASRFDKVVAVSRDVRDLLVVDCGLRPDRVEVIHNGLLIPPARENPGRKGRFVIGSAGRFFPVKDYPFMVEIAREVVGRREGICFELAGDGPMLGEIEELIHRYGLENYFVLRGFLGEMSAFYSGLDLYLNTSFHEGIPMSVLEAMAHGIPVIVPRVGGLGEIVTDGLDGYAVTERSPASFAERCLAIHENEPLCLQMGQAARVKVSRQFSMERMVEAYAALYFRAITKETF